MESSFTIERIEVTYNTRLGYFSLIDHNRKISGFFDGDDATEILEKLDELGETTEFLDWFYNSELDLACNDDLYKKEIEYKETLSKRLKEITEEDPTHKKGKIQLEDTSND